MDEALRRLLDHEGHRDQAIELLHALDDEALWRQALEAVPIGEGRFRNQDWPTIEESWWPLVEAAPELTGLPDRLLVQTRRVTRLPPLRELVLDGCTVATSTLADRVVLAACTVEEPLPALAEVELHWPQGALQLGQGHGHLQITGLLKGPQELQVDCERLTLLWAHATRRVQTTAARVSVVDCEALEAVGAPGSVTSLRTRLPDHFTLEDEDEDALLTQLHASQGLAWPRFVHLGPRLCELGARWVADWTDTDAILLEKQGPWEDLLAAFRGWPEAPMAAAQSVLTAFRSRPRLERFLNRSFHNPWGLNERTFGRAGLPALGWLVEHPRCPERGLVQQVAARVAHLPR